MDEKGECLAYFRAATSDPLSVPPWSEWWAANEEKARAVFPRYEYLRLKHRKLQGAVGILQALGELPDPWPRWNPLRILTCSLCGERTIQKSSVGGGMITCPECGSVCVYDSRPDPL